MLITRQKNIACVCVWNFCECAWWKKCESSQSPINPFIHPSWLTPFTMCHPKIAVCIIHGFFSVHLQNCSFYTHTQFIFFFFSVQNKYICGIAFYACWGYIFALKMRHNSLCRIFSSRSLYKCNFILFVCVCVMYMCVCVHYTWGFSHNNYLILQY